jgi:transcriptional regulator of nitric oxide reductase
MRGIVFVLAGAFAIIAVLATAPMRVNAADKSVHQLAAALFSIDAKRVTVGAQTGTPPVIRVERDGVLVGYLASTLQVVGSVGYSGKPIDIMIAIDTKAVIVGARLISQSEPILTIGISPADLARHVDGFAQIKLGDITDTGDLPGAPDALTGATVSSGVIRDGIIRTSRAVALAYGLLEDRTLRRIDTTGFVKQDWNTLLASGALGHRLITMGDVRGSLRDPAYKSHAGVAEQSFIDIYYGLLTPAQIGQNLLGKLDFGSLIAGSGLGDHSIFVAASGLYSFKGTGWRKSGVFERIELHQDNRSIRLIRDRYRNFERLKIAGAPQFREIAAFTVPASARFDPTRPWRLSLLVSHETEDGAHLTTAFPLHYTLPRRFTLAGADTEFKPAAAVLWQRNWQARIPAIVIVCLMLLVLAAILVFQDWLVRRIGLYKIARLSFLVMTLVLLGWVLGAQLSVVQVLAFAQAIRTGFQWETFLLDPLIFILWGAVAVSLLFWGRGVYCGWLCPFGALQELLNMAARGLRIRQIMVPFGLHERLWPIKYVLFVGLFALSLHSISQAFVFAEVEPFKTAMTLRFMREWPFIAYVGALLFAGLFIERAFCRYLCPLGAALAIPARLRMFEWLKRRRQCGTQCSICADQCTVQAIHPDGHINPNECIHCLRCQTSYFDVATCPPLRSKAQRRAAHQAGLARAAQLQEQDNG